MTMVTKSEMANRVLQKLFVLEGGETASAEDFAIATGAVSSLYEELREDELCYWDDDEAPLFAKEQLALLIACNCAHELAPGDAVQFISMNERKSRARLIHLLQSRERVNSTTKAEYF